MSEHDQDAPRDVDSLTGEKKEAPLGEGARGKDRRAFLVGSLVAGAAAGLGSCKRAGDTSARKGEDPPAEPEAARPRAAGDPPPPPPREARPPERRSAEPAGRPAAAREAAPQAPRTAVAARSRVVQIVNAKAYDVKGAPDPKPVKVMVDQAVMALTGADTPEKAWKSLFKPSERVGLKPNSLGRELCWTHPATVDAVIEGLLMAGVPYGNMVMWDMWGFEASPLSSRYRKSPMQVKPIKAWGFERKAHTIPSGPPVKFTKALAAVDAVVNLPVIKDHDLAGVTCALKNMAFGSIPNPWAFHATRSGERLCDPMVPEIYALPPIRDKMRLILADAFSVIIDGGPKGNPRGLRKLHSVFAATDPVAMDRIAWKIIDDLRVAAKLPKLEDKPGKVGRPAHVLTAARMGLGTGDLARIDHVVKTLG